MECDGFTFIGEGQDIVKVEKRYTNNQSRQRLQEVNSFTDTRVLNAKLDKALERVILWANKE